jgi:sulfatase maturation enzyme AslB (radical SAM superfamily)
MRWRSAFFRFLSKSLTFGGSNEKVEVSINPAFYPSGKYYIPIKDNLDVQQEQLFYKWLELGTLKNKDYLKCPAIGICGGGRAYNIYIKTGKLGIKEDYFCTFQKEILKLLLTYNFLMIPQNKLEKTKS